MKLIKTGYLLMVLVTLSACDKSVPEVQEETIRPAKIVAAIDAVGNQIRQFPATVEATEDAMLAFRVSGEVEKFHVVAGQEVSKGELLVKLDPKDYQLLLQQNEARYELSLSQFKRANQLKDQKLISSAEFDQTEAELKIAKANLDTARSNLNYTELHAPFDGVVARIFVENFESVQAKQTVLELQNRDTIDVAVQVPEAIVVHMDKGSQESFTYQPTLVFDANPNINFKVTLKEYDVSPDPSTKTYKAVFSLKEPEQMNILPGMTGTMSVELDQVTDLSFGQPLVPGSAVFVPNDKANEGQQYVLLVNEDMIVELTKVTAASIGQQGIVIAEGLKVGDRVVAAGVHSIKPGTKIKEWRREGGL